jgi:hypothetical protein
MATAASDNRNMKTPLLSLTAFTFVLGLPLACSDEASGGSGGAGASTGDGASGNAGGAGAGFTQGGGGGSGGEEPCAQQSSEATLVSQPVDIIFVIDNSGSMSEEIEEVEFQINANFASIIDGAVPPIDYRVIMVSEFGDSGSQAICVAAPLGGTPDDDGDGRCDAVGSAPVNTEKFFHHSASISSHDALCQLVEQLTTPDEFGLQPNGYQAVLRPEAFKFFAVITDDNVSCGDLDDGNSAAEGQAVADAWDLALRTAAPDQFGGPSEDRRYSFWSIVAMAPLNPSGGDPYGEPHGPMDPIVTQECTPSAVNPGTGYQALSVLSSGYRFPSCGLDYTDIFTLMAQGVIQGASVACEFPVPDPPQGQTLDLATVQVRYSSGGVEVATFDQVATAGECTPTSFFIEANTIKLCPEACAVVQADEGATIDILFGCNIDVQ